MKGEKKKFSEFYYWIFFFVFFFLFFFYVHPIQEYNKLIVEDETNDTGCREIIQWYYKIFMIILANMGICIMNWKNVKLNRMMKIERKKNKFIFI